nr:DUF2764 family protein [Methylosarcina fibrata]
MPHRCQYTLLLASLPHQPRQFFSDGRTLLSREQLDRRLRLLDASDAAELQRIEALAQGFQFENENDETMLSSYLETAGRILNDEMRRLALWHLELRILLSALRLRLAGASAPERTSFPGAGTWQDAIKKNWHKNDFGLGYRVPWLADAHALLANGRPHELEKFLLELIWRHYIEVGNRHYFDFTAVALYVLRWDLSRRWSSYRGDEAVACFDRLVETGLKDCDLSLEIR